MAKELPYFKFEPNQWENGNIQMLSKEDKGLFIDLCSMYWSRLGDLPEKLAIQKLCGGNAVALKSLYDEKIIEVSDGNIYINFLSEQLNEFNDISKKNSKNAKDGWEKRRKLSKNAELSDRNATALNLQCESDAIREDKIIEDNKDICVDESTLIDYQKFIDYFNSFANRNFRVSEKIKKTLKARLNVYTKLQLQNAIKNAHSDDYHIGTNFKYLTPEFILREDKLERFINNPLTKNYYSALHTIPLN
jgi:uncharacterized phage protein (TIGR02220 family)